MFQMDIETLKKYEDYAKPLTENDKKRLMQLEKMELPDKERKLITYMLHFRIPVRSIDHVETKTDF